MSSPINPSSPIGEPDFQDWTMPNYGFAEVIGELEAIEGIFGTIEGIKKGVKVTRNGRGFRDSVSPQVNNAVDVLTRIDNFIETYKLLRTAKASVKSSMELVIPPAVTVLTKEMTLEGAARTASNESVAKTASAITQLTRETVSVLRFCRSQSAKKEDSDISTVGNLKTLLGVINNLSKNFEEGEGGSKSSLLQGLENLRMTYIPDLSKSSDLSKLDTIGIAINEFMTKVPEELQRTARELSEIVNQKASEKRPAGFSSLSLGDDALSSRKTPSPVSASSESSTESSPRTNSPSEFNEERWVKIKNEPLLYIFNSIDAISTIFDSIAKIKPGKKASFEGLVSETIPLPIQDIFGALKEKTQGWKLLNSFIGYIESATEAIKRKATGESVDTTAAGIIKTKGQLVGLLKFCSKAIAEGKLEPDHIAAIKKKLTELEDALPRVKEGFQNLAAAYKDDPAKQLKVIDSAFEFNNEVEEAFAEVKIVMKSKLESMSTLSPKDKYESKRKNSEEG